MDDLSHRERVLKALDHQEPDRVPIDFCGTFATCINLRAYENLKRHLNVDSETKPLSWRAQTARVDTRILDMFDVDTRMILSRANVEVETFPDGSFKDEWGVIRSRPTGGHFIETGPPFEEDATLEALKKHPWPDPDSPQYVAGLAADAGRLHSETDYAVILNMPVGVVHQAQFLRGYQGWMEDMVLNRKFFDALMDKVTEIWVRLAEKMLDAVGENADIIFVGDDLGFQNGPMVSPKTYRELIKPWHKRAYDAIKERTSVKIIHHSCGSVYAMLDDLIDLGVSVLNPVQVSAKDMDTRRLKREYGNRLSFWGGIDTQHVLPHGTPKDVKEEVKRRIEDLAPGGGYVPTAVHNIQAEVPPENIRAMFEAIHEYGRY